MHIQYGYTVDLACETAVPVITMLDVHTDRRSDITDPDTMSAKGLADGAAISVDAYYLDAFGNICRRFTAPPGGVRLSAAGVVFDNGFPEEQPVGARLLAPEQLPAETLPFLLATRYCEVDRLADRAWRLFGHIPGGYDRVQAICDFVHTSVRFGYEHANNMRSAANALDEGVGVCRDFAHLAIALCRAVNVPARYCTGYLGDIGVPIEPFPMDFSAWFEVFLDGAWWPFDARHNTPRIGRILVARGRDATDVPILHSFGKHTLTRFDVVTEEVQGARFPTTGVARREHHARRIASAGLHAPM
jgi:transglutaminase-like putative cysteine protease